MPDYSNGKIYKIVCNITGETYYGSTTQKISMRVGKHKQEALYRVNPCVSKQIILRGNYDYSLVEECPCDNKEQLHKCERWFIENNECINKTIPGRTKADKAQASKNYYEANRDKEAARKKIYRENNKEEISSRNKKRYTDNKDKESERKKIFYSNNKMQYEKYYQDNKEKITERKKQHYEDNRQMYLDKACEYRKTKKERNAMAQEDK